NRTCWLFFFSSRRRHTRFSRDWSSDVCSSDLVTFAESGVSTPDRRSWLFDVYDGNVWERFFVPEGEITERGEITYAQGEMVGYEWTISTYPDAAGNLVYHAYMAPEVDEVTS